MKGHGHEQVRLRHGEARAPHLEDQIAERRGECAPSPELQTVHRLADDVAVPRGRTGIRERRRPPSARAAPMGRLRPRLWLRGGAEAPELDPADAAPRRRDARDALPALAADRVAAAGAERAPAHGAERGEQQIDRGGQPAAPSRGRIGRYRRELIE
jgi:hypothetical protein